MSLSPSISPDFIPYRAQDLELCLDLFRSQVPAIFQAHEIPDYFAFLTRQGLGSYWLMEVSGETVGAGGFYLQPGGFARLCYDLVRSDWKGRGLEQKRIDFLVSRLLLDPAVKRIEFQVASPHDVENLESLGSFKTQVSRSESGESSHHVCVEIPSCD